MKMLFTLFVFSMFTFFESDQGGMSLTEYPSTTSCHKDSLDFVAPPMAITDCEMSGIEVTIDDRMFSGGAYGVIERKWSYADSCGNTTSAMQYISLRD